MNWILYCIGITIALIGLFWAPFSETCIGHEINTAVGDALSKYQTANDSQATTGIVAELTGTDSDGKCNCRQEIHLALAAGANV